ncbi:hypothetical protein HDU98_001529 [Podochytrium sp. JEL0797]|nr:hypothetical protein HDU98_001529 [Podochytrium sp. JEL0797]
MLETNALHATAHSSQKTERIRLALQMLRDLGLGTSVAALLSESGVALETAAETQLRRVVLGGDWAQAVAVVAQAGGKGEAASRLAIHTQHFLELLESDRPTDALKLLRHDISPLCSDHAALHKLSSLIMCPSVDDFKRKANWDGANASSRATLLTTLQKNIFMGSMLPERRLETLLQQAVEQQAKKCLYHNVPNDSISLLNDHSCPRSTFPTKTTQILTGHSDEVWFLAFSPSGEHLASASKDQTVIIWDAHTFEPVHILRGHEDHVSVVAWSMDSQRLITGSNDRSVKLWDVNNGECLQTYTLHTDTITSLAFLPTTPTTAFVSSSIDKNILLWSLEGHVLHKWNGVRVTDLNITNDGSKMVTISDKRIRVFDMSTKEEILSLQEQDSITSINTSTDGRYALVNVSACQEIHMWDLHENRILRKFTGHKQGRFVIRSCFGGTAQTFVLSGSEDSNVYVWNREHGVLLECLEGHSATVNSISWNSKMNLFASASDDCTIRIWRAVSNL